MEQKIKKTIARHQLIEPGEKIIVGISGGADSVCLLFLLCGLREAYGLTLYAAHVNHGIRGAEAHRDEAFVKDFCEKLSVACFTEHVDAKKYAREKGISEEAAGRELRYAFFLRLKKELSADKIATAHNRDDNSETVLMHLIRGSGMEGLCGIPYQRGPVIRPLLDYSRKEIEELCKGNCLAYVTDRTNQEQIYTRNKLRLDLIPKIQREYNPNVKEAVANTADILKEEADYLRRCTEEAYSRIVRDGEADLAGLRQEHPAIRRRIIRRMIARAYGTENNIFSDYITAIMDMIDKEESGKRIDLGHGFSAYAAYDRLRIGARETEPEGYAYLLELEVPLEIPETGIRVLALPADQAGKNSFTFPEGAVLQIRSRRNGDVFYPEGMSGKKKLKDYFIDEKISREQRNLWPLLSCGGEIAWIIGKRRDRRFSFHKKGVSLKIEKI